MIASAIWSPTVKTGLSEVIGSWKIIEISLPRIVAHLLLRELEQIFALVQIWPPTIRPGGVGSGA